MAKGFSIKVSGQKEMKRKVLAFAAAFPIKVGNALYREGEAIMTISKVSYVPVDLGTLKSTGHVLGPIILMKDIRVDLVYGGPAAPYALRQHEMDYAHEVGEWKYLETPMKLAVPFIMKNIAMDLKL